MNGKKSGSPRRRFGFKYGQSLSAHDIGQLLFKLKNYQWGNTES